MLWVILATGESMTQEQADFVRGKCRVAVVSDAYKLAPWADALISNDAAWWRVHPEAIKFAGRKFCGTNFAGTERAKLLPGFQSGSNSGLVAMMVAEKLGATKILLLGFDMHGSHFFGQHAAPLRNTTPSRFSVHRNQFKRWRGCPVINCTPNSSLKCFPMDTIQNALARAEAA